FVAAGGGRGAGVKILVLGATSAIAEATARLYAGEGAELLLVGRQGERLAVIAADLRLRGAARVEIAMRDLAQSSDAMADLASFAAALRHIDHNLVPYAILR